MAINSCSKCISSSPCNDDPFLFGEFHCKFKPHNGFSYQQKAIVEWLNERFRRGQEMYQCPSFIIEKRKGV